MAQASQVYRVFGALLSSLTCFVIHLCCHGRDLQAASSGTHCFLSGIFLLFRAVSSRIWRSVREGVWVFPSCNPGCCREVSGLQQSDVRVCPYPVPRLWRRAAPNVFLQDTRILPIMSCQTPGGMGSNSPIDLEVLAKLRWFLSRWFHRFRCDNLI